LQQTKAQQVSTHVATAKNKNKNKSNNQGCVCVDPEVGATGSGRREVLARAADHAAASC
jgi:hypothetical protein